MIKTYCIDTFTDRLFFGSPAVVCHLDNWLDEDKLISLSKENAVPESAFIVEKNNEIEIRWFTHKKEITLCGHATLAAAYVVSHYVHPNLKKITFKSIAGEIVVYQNSKDNYKMYFTPFRLEQIDITKELKATLNILPKEVWVGRDYICVYDRIEDIKKINPIKDNEIDFKGKLISVTARGIETDCVVRTFVPHNGMAEEEACGSAHCHAIPYWSKKLNKNKLSSRQESKRTGLFNCEMTADNKIAISGNCVLFSKGEIEQII